MSEPNLEYSSNRKLIGDLPYVLETYGGMPLVAKFNQREPLISKPLITQMRDFISKLKNYISNPNKEHTELLFLSMKNLLVGNNYKLNMKSIDKKTGSNLEKEFKNTVLFLGLRTVEDLDNIEPTEFNKFVKQFYTYYVIAVLKEDSNIEGSNFQSDPEIFQDINNFLKTLEASGGSRKRRRSSPRKSKKRSSKTTSKGKKKVSKKSKGKKRKSQVKRRSRNNNNNNRNHGNH